MHAGQLARLSDAVVRRFASPGQRPLIVLLISTSLFLIAPACQNKVEPEKAATVQPQKTTDAKPQFFTDHMPPMFIESDTNSGTCALELKHELIEKRTMKKEVERVAKPDRQLQYGNIHMLQVLKVNNGNLMYKEIHPHQSETLELTLDTGSAKPHPELRVVGGIDHPDDNSIKTVLITVSDENADIGSGKSKPPKYRHDVKIRDKMGDKKFKISEWRFNGENGSAGPNDTFYFLITFSKP